MSAKIKCPACGPSAKVVPAAGGLFRCTKCGGFLDDDPSEGGDYSDRNAAARIEREERRRARR